MSDHPKKIRTRFAPSPTGFVHIGNVRTALFGYLFAKHNNGTFILRVEDTDRARLVEGAVENLLSVMKTLGIVPDEGFYLDDEGQVKERGEYGPYLQSERLPLYQKHVLQLIESGKAYYCYCSEQRLEDLRKEQTALKKPPMYDRHCRNLTDEQKQQEKEKCMAEGRNPVVRFAMPTEGQTIIHDLIYGDISYENRILDDQVILKSDGFPTYHLAVVVDDHFMEISHVTRTEEWIPSTPKHLLLYAAFGWEPPQFAHMPLLLNADKSKLSKRQGDVATEDFLKKGYLPEALINFLAFMGWNPKTEQEVFSMDDLIRIFDLGHVNNSGAIFDINKLDWMNGLYIRTKSDRELVELLRPYWKESGVEVEKYDESYLEAVAGLEKDRLKKLSEIGERTSYFFKSPEYDASLLVWKKADAADAKAKLSVLLEALKDVPEENFTKEELEQVIKDVISKNGFENGNVLWPLRAALTGLPASPGPFEVAGTLALGLGKQEILNRIQRAVEKLK
jgi:nondiscriminating glutamyl-tRNA synthetase